MDDQARRSAPGSFIRLSKGFTHYELAGPPDGKAVVLVNGFSIPYYLWNHTFFPLVHAGFKVLRFDFFGRGYSDRPDVEYGADLFDQQIVELLDALGIHAPVNLIGSSMGGVVSAIFADRHPERVKKLALIDPAGMMSRPSFPLSALNLSIIGEIIMDLFGDWILIPGMADDLVHPQEFPEYISLYIPQMSFHGFKRAVLSTMRSGILYKYGEIFERIGKQDLATLIIWGENDRVIPLSVCEKMKGLLPKANIKIIDRAGHVPQYELPEVVNPILIDFINSQL